MPQPHKSWRQCLLMVIVFGLLVGLFVKFSKKCCLPRIIEYLHMKADEQKVEVAAISQQMKGQSEQEMYSLIDLKNYLDQQVKKLNLQLEAFEF